MTEPNGPRQQIDRPGGQQWVPEHAGLDELRAVAAQCRGCELWEPATRVVFSAGNPKAAIALVGEQPGDVEDQRGIPFVGPAGRLLQRAVEDAGLPRDQLYVTNAVKHFRFTGRGKRRIHATPELAHITACRPWLVAELQLVDPQVVVVLGATAARSLLGPQFRVTRHRGEVLTEQTTRGSRRFVPTVHPSSVLRVPESERPAAYGALVADLSVVAKALG
jgi:DNA polymerase